MTQIIPSLGLYIHIPFCEKKCSYCGFYSVPVKGHNVNRLLSALVKEIELYEFSGPVETVYIGGGSPTCLPEAILVELVDFLTSRYKDIEEFTVECNPAQLSSALSRDLRASGVNRISIGAQSFDPEELKMMGRIHSPEQIPEAATAARDAGFENIAIDMIFGLSDSDLMAWQNTLEKAMSLGVQHISTYSLTIEKGTPFEKAIQQGSLTMIDEAVERTMYELARIQLQDAGFKQYEISNFARLGFECLHNLRYWKNLPVIGIGPAAASWYNGKRTTNVCDIDTYITQIEAGQLAWAEEQTPDPEQIAIETAVLGLRMRKGIDLRAYKVLTGVDLEGQFGGVIQKNYDLGFLERTETYVSLTDFGLSFADTVAQDFTIPD